MSYASREQDRENLPALVCRRQLRTSIVYQTASSMERSGPKSSESSEGTMRVIKQYENPVGGCHEQI